jgi:hypothetical protein
MIQPTVPCEIDAQCQGSQDQNEDGVYLAELADGAVIEVETKNHHYTLVKSAPGQARISGHPKLCPEPVTVEIDGSAGGGIGLKPGFIGRGMHLIFEHPTYHTVTISRILGIHCLA